jgi:hypothetical protein
MNRRTRPDEKQRELPLFVEESVTVPEERRLELESALAELLLDVSKSSNAGAAEGGSQ